MCYIVRVYAVLQFSPCFLRAFRVCVNVCVNKKSPAEAGDSARGKNDIIITALNAGTTFLFAEVAIMPIIKRVIIPVGFF